MEPFFKLLCLFWRQTNKVLTILKDTAQEESSPNDIVDLSVIVPQTTIPGKSTHPAFFVADQSDTRKGVNCLNVSGLGVDISVRIKPEWEILPKR